MAVKYSQTRTYAANVGRTIAANRPLEDYWERPSTR